MHVSVYVHTHLYMYLYIYRERERERPINGCRWGASHEICLALNRRFLKTERPKGGP